MGGWKLYKIKTCGKRTDAHLEKGEMQNRWEHPTEERSVPGGREWASVMQVCGTRLLAATDRIYSRQFSRRDVIKNIYILRCSGGQEISLCGYSEKQRPAATTGLLSEGPTAASAGHPHRSWYHCFWALNAALCTF